MELSLEKATDINKSAHEKYQETLSKTTKAHAAAEQALQATINRLQRDLDSLREGGAASNDSLRAKDYSKNSERSIRPAASLTSLIADEQKQKGKEKEKEKEQEVVKSKEKEERDRQEKEREEKERERQEKDRQSNDKQVAVFKQKIADLEAKHREAAEQVHYLTFQFYYKFYFIFGK